MDYRESRGKAPPPDEYIRYVVLPKMGYPLSEQRGMSLMDEKVLFKILSITGY